MKIIVTTGGCSVSVMSQARPRRIHARLAHPFSDD
jgi:hypothetical protein